MSGFSMLWHTDPVQTPSNVLKNNTSGIGKTIFFFTDINDLKFAVTETKLNKDSRDMKYVVLIYIDIVLEIRLSLESRKSRNC